MQIDLPAEGLGFTEGPVWLDDHRIALTSISHGCIYIVDPSGGATKRIETGGGPNGLARGSNGTLFVAQNGGAFGASGPAQPGVQMITDGRVEYLVTELGAPNDLMFGPDGRLWVTDTRCEIDPVSPGDGLPGQVWAVDVVTGHAELIVASGPVFINGLGFTRDGRTLLVTATLAAELLAYRLAPAGAASWAQPRLVHACDNGWPDGIAISARGETWVALTAADRVDVINGAGERTASITLRMSCSSPLRTPSRCCVSASTNAVTPASAHRCIQLHYCGYLHLYVACSR
ncbi:MAG: SMP-30/gluconolactonase/LRE family protein, partial [Mycobacterium sp.]|uniref:SMP-30/gluconolactonase/LRE family protein n=1 Tax=Mycobacterium sp. TaxID=1785 RepID=UPI00389A9CF6